MLAKVCDTWQLKLAYPPVTWRQEQARKASPEMCKSTLLG